MTLDKTADAVQGRWLDNGLRLTPLGGPTVLIELGGVRLLIDPTFDPPQEYPIGSRSLRKTRPSAWSAEQVGAVDAVLLSHDQHPDNLDHAGRNFLASAPMTLSTALAAERLGGTAMGLATWATTPVIGGGGGQVSVTAVPAQHGPDGTEHLTGPVTGFVVHGAELPTVYVSGDNASLNAVRAIAAHFAEIDVAILFAGAARTPLVDGNLTLSGAEAATAADILGRPLVLSAHTDSWAHFTEDTAAFRRAFDEAGLAHLLMPVEAGQPVIVDGHR